MTSLILRTATRYLLPLLLLLSIYLLLRGHNEPGGGFVGGLVAASAYALHMIAYTVESARRILRVEPRTLIAAGLLTALGSGAASWAIGAPFMTGLWLEQPIPVAGKVGTPFIFDVGVYFVVIGVSLMILFTVAEVE
ncbi:MAG: Na+/H+ antiporter subunit B [Syntrophobacteraceae bacterium]|jgi:multicomponent Na+:H+ antiporter subunit B|nr:Na+/H+ antiporter subunit B [Syntrophobacteraceae bacterium]